MRLTGQRLGKFLVSFEMLEREMPTVRQMMAGIVVVDARAMWHKHAVEYVGIGEMFDAFDELAEPRWYEPLVERKIADLLTGTTEVTITWRRWPC